MADVNTVVIACNKQELINSISQKLVLLRNLDKVRSCSISQALNVFEETAPNVLILHCDNNDVQALSLIRQIKKQEVYKNIPILLINENCSRETIIEAFDSGISDVIFMPVIDYELLIRVIWCLKRNEKDLNNEARINFMKELKIIEPETEIYTREYCGAYLKNQIAQTRKYTQNACILLITPDRKYPERNIEDFITTVKKSLRTNDSIVTKNEKEFYIYLPKTKLNGAYSVFERINAALGANCAINAGLVEVQDQEFDDIMGSLDNALKKASMNTKSLIVASDFYSDSERPQLNLEKPRVTPSVNPEIQVIEEEPKAQTEQIQETQTQQEPQVFNTSQEAPKAPVEEVDKNSAKMLYQAYSQKLKIVVAPAFRKFENIVRMKGLNIQINSYTGDSSVFSLSKKDVTASFALEYNGDDKTTVHIRLINAGELILSEDDTVKFTILDVRNMSIMLNELVDKFLSILKNTF